MIPCLSKTEIKCKDIFEENGEYYYINDSITTRGLGGTLNARPNLGYSIYYNPITLDKIAVCDYDITLAKTSNVFSDLYTDNVELIKKGYIAIRPPMVRGKLGCWTWSIDKFNSNKHEIVITGKKESYSVKKRTFVPKEKVIRQNGKLQYWVEIKSNSRSILEFSTNDGTSIFSNLIGNGIFNNPKNVEMLKYFISLIDSSDFTVLDFFSGSSTTAHAVILQNFQDVFDGKKGKRKFIMVQLPEKTDEKSEAYKAGYKNICEIGKERIRRAGKNEYLSVVGTAGGSLRWNEKRKAELGDDYFSPSNVDIGFRVLKLDSSNMKDVYYNPAEFSKNLLDTTIDNIKEDRTPEDLLFQVMLDLGVLLSSKIEETEIAGKKVFNVADGFLIACFDNDVNEEVITAVAKQQPIYFVMRDSSLSTDTTATNFDQIFETYSPDTVRKVI